MMKCLRSRRTLLILGLAMVLFAGVAGLGIPANASKLVNSLYGIFIINSEGSIVSELGTEYGDSNNAESFGKYYYFRDKNGQVVPVLSGHGIVRTASFPFYDGDKVSIQWSSQSNLTDRKDLTDEYIITFSDGRAQQFISMPLNKTTFTIPTNFFGKIEITAKDKSIMHSINSNFNGAHLSVLIVNVVPRSTSIVGGSSLEHYVGLISNGSHVYNGSAQSPFNLISKYITVANDVTKTDVGNYYAIVKPKLGYMWDNGTYAARPISWSITPKPITIAFESTTLTKNFSDSAFTYALKNAGEGNGTVTYQSSNQSVATVDNVGRVNIVGVGKTVITAKKAVDSKGNYSAAQADYTLTVDKGNQTTFAWNSKPSASNYILGNADNNFALTTQNGESTGGVTYSVTKGEELAAVTSAGAVSLSGAGTVEITATKAGDANYNDSSVTYTFTVTAAVARIDSVFYSDVKTAIDSAAAGQTVELLSDCTLTAPVNVSKNITVKGKTGDEILSFAAGVSVNVVSGGNLTVTSLTADGGAKWATGSGGLNANNGIQRTTAMFRVEEGGSLSLGDKAVLKNADNYNSASADGLGAAVYTAGNFTMAKGASVERNQSDSGAIYLAGKAIASIGGNVSDNQALSGGGIYAASGSKLSTTPDAALHNNVVTERGQSVYLEQGADYLYNNSQVDGTIYLGANADGSVIASVTVQGDSMKSLVLDLSDDAVRKYKAADNNDKPVYPLISAENSSSVTVDDLKENVRVLNSGITTKKGADSLQMIASSEYVAAIKKSDGTVERFTSIQEAIAAAAVTDTVYVMDTKRTVGGAENFDNNKILTSYQPAVVPANKNITLASAVWTVAADGTTTGLVTEGTDTMTLKRGQGLSGAMITVEEGGSLTVTNVILDGGADWNNKPVSENIVAASSAAGDVTSENSGVAANAPVIVNKGSLTLENGSVIQNNENKFNVFGSENYGGGVANIGGAKLDMENGAVIKDCYAREGGGITNVNKAGVTVTGNEVNIAGTISGCVSQTKGAAAETIYGNATTNIKAGAVIEKNVSKWTYGSATVEEGGILNIEGGAITAPEGGKAIYVYNKYGEKDISDPRTYVELAHAGQLNVTGGTVSGNIYLDNPCTAVKKDPVTGAVVDSEDYSTFVDFGNNSGNYTVEVNESRPLGSSIAKGKDLTGVTVLQNLANPKDENVKRFAYLDGNAADGYQLKQGGYDVTVSQTSDGKLKVDLSSVYGLGKVTVKVTVDGVEQSVEITVDPDTRSGSGTVGYDAAEAGAVDFKIDYTLDGKAVSDVFEDKALWIVTNPATGEITIPSNKLIQIKDGNGDFTDLKFTGTGLIPNGAQIDGDGYITVKSEGFEQKIYVGNRSETPAVGSDTEAGQIAGDVIDYTDVQATVTITVTAEAGYEYNIRKPDGTLAVSEWKSTADKKIVFEGLDANVKYEVVARKKATDALLPSEYVEIGEVTTLDSANQTIKKEFEDLFIAQEDKLAPNNSADIDPAKLVELVEKIENLGFLKEIPSVKEKIDRIFVTEALKELEAKYQPYLNAKDDYLDSSAGNGETGDAFAHVKKIYEQARQDVLDSLTANPTKESLAAIVAQADTDMGAVKTAEEIRTPKLDELKSHYDSLVGKIDGGYGNLTSDQKTAVKNLLKETYDAAVSDLSGKNTLETIQTSFENAVKEMNKTLAVESVKAKHEIVTDTGVPTTDDLEAIKTALADIETFTDGRDQEILDEIRDSLIAKKNEILRAELEKLKTPDSSESLKNVVDGYISEMNAAAGSAASSGAAEDKTASEKLDELFVKANAAASVQKKYDEILSRKDYETLSQEVKTALAGALADELARIRSLDAALTESQVQAEADKSALLLEREYSKAAADFFGKDGNREVAALVASAKEELAKSSTDTAEEMAEIVQTLKDKISVAEAREKIKNELSDLLKETDSDTTKQLVADAVSAIESKANDGKTATKEYFEQVLKDTKTEVELERYRDRARGIINAKEEKFVGSGKYSESGTDRIKELCAEAIAGLKNTQEKNDIDIIVSVVSARLDELKADAIGSGIKPDGGSHNTGDSHPEYDADSGNTSGEVIGSITNEDGFVSDWNLVIKKTEADKETGKKSESLFTDAELKQTFNVSMWRNGSVVATPDGKYVVSILLTKEQRNNKELHLTYITSDGEVKAVDAERKGDFLVFKTDALGTFQLLGDKNINLVWLIVVLSVIAAAELVFLCLRIHRRRKEGKDGDNSVKAKCSVLPLALLGAVVYAPNGAIAIVAVLAALVVILAVAIILTYLFRKKAEPIPVPDPAAVGEGYLFAARYNKSFTARLILSSQESKDFYADIKKKLLSYEGVKNRISWNGESFHCGRQPLAKVTIKGKTLDVCLALSMEDSDEKFRAEDVSSSKKCADVPLRMRVKGVRAAGYTLELVDRMMKKYGIAFEKECAEDYSEFLAERTVEQLVSEGLILEVFNEEQYNEMKLREGKKFPGGGSVLKDGEEESPDPVLTSDNEN